MLQSRMLHAKKLDAAKSDSFSHCFLCYMLQFFCSMLHATLSNMFVINWCSMLQTTFDLCFNSVRMCMEVRNTLERLCVQLNMADTKMSAAESSCDEKHEKRKRKGKWNEENVAALIDLLEEGPCLWNIFDSQYTKASVSWHIWRCTQIKECLCWCTITAPRPLCEFSCWQFHVSKA